MVKKITFLLVVSLLATHTAFGMGRDNDRGRGRLPFGVGGRGRGNGMPLAHLIGHMRNLPAIQNAPVAVPAAHQNRNNEQLPAFERGE